MAAVVLFPVRPGASLWEPRGHALECLLLAAAAHPAKSARAQLLQYFLCATSPLCLLAASASTRPNAYFYLGVSVLILLAWTSVRPRRVSWPAGSLAVMVVLGGRTQPQGLRYAQNAWKPPWADGLPNCSGPLPDPRECRTSIGHSRGDSTVRQNRLAPARASGRCSALPPPRRRLRRLQERHLDRRQQ